MRNFAITVLGVLCVFGIFAGNRSEDKKLKVVTNLHDFMEDYTKEAMKYFKKTGDRSYLVRLLPSFPELTVEEQKEDWKKIVDKHLNDGRPENSCKSCHDLYKKEYKKNYRKREITIPESILGLDQDIERAMKN